MRGSRKPAIVSDEPILPTFPCPFCGTTLMLWEEGPDGLEWFVLCEECTAGAMIHSPMLPPLTPETRLYLP